MLTILKKERSIHQKNKMMISREFQRSAKLTYNCALNFRQMLSKHEPVYQALWAGPCDFDEVLISPVMIQDHMPDNMLRALNKVSQADAIVRQVKRSQAPLSRTPSVKPGHYEPLEETTDGPDVLDEVAVANRRLDRTTRTENVISDLDRSAYMGYPVRLDCVGVDSASIIVDVQVHERKEARPNEPH